MNERIRELAEQAGFTANDEQKVFLKVYEQELEKFAELIVKECANVQFVRSCERHGYDKHEDSKIILKHFGVNLD